MLSRGFFERESGPGTVRDTVLPAGEPDFADTARLRGPRRVKKGEVLPPPDAFYKDRFEF
jgi:hypothetical protein